MKLWNEDWPIVRTALNERPEDTLAERARAIEGLCGRSANAIRQYAAGQGYECTSSVVVDKGPEVLYAEIARLKKILASREDFDAAVDLAVRESIAALPALKIPPPVKLTKKPADVHTAMLLLGDCQAGEAFSAADVSSAGRPYGWDVFTERARKISAGVRKITKIHRAYAPVHNLKIIFLGDIIEGEEIYRGQRGYIDRPIFDQVFGAAEVLSNIVSELAAEFKQVTCYCVWGNHGRLGKDFRDDQNCDTLCYRFMKMRLAPVKNAEMIISASYKMLFRLPELPEYIWLAWHGDNIRSYLNTPYYGLERAVAQEIMLNNMGIHYTLLGHHHRDAMIGLPHGELIVNSSWVGTSPYSSKVMRTGGTPSQSFFFLHPEYGITSRWPIWLAKKMDLRPNGKGLYTPEAE